MRDIRTLNQTAGQQIESDEVMTRIGELSSRNYGVLGKMSVLNKGKALFTEGLRVEPSLNMTVNVVSGGMFQRDDLGNIFVGMQVADQTITMDAASGSPRVDIVECQIKTITDKTDYARIGSVATGTGGGSVIITNEEIKRDLKTYIAIQKKTGSTTATAATSGSLTGTVSIPTTIDLSSKYLINISDGEDGPFIEVDCRGATPSATTKAEIVSAFNTALSRTIASLSGNFIVLTGFSTGIQSIFTIKPPITDSGKDALEEIFGVSAGGSYRYEYQGVNPWVKLCEIDIGAASTEITSGMIRNLDQKSTWASDGSNIYIRPPLTDIYNDQTTGYIGLNTESPDNYIHIEDSAQVISNTQLTLESGYNGYGAGINFVSRTSSGGTRVAMAKITADGENAWDATAANQDAGLRFFTALNGALSEKMRLTSDGYLGINEQSPQALLHLYGSIAKFIIQDDDNASSYFEIYDESTSLISFNKYAFNTAGIMEFNIHPGSTSNALYKFFLDTNTSGSKFVGFYKGDGTSTIHNIIGVDGQDSYFQIGGGNFGISESAPERLLHVTGADMGASQSFSSTMGIFENSGSCDIIVRGTTGSAVYFGDAADGDIGGVSYNHSTNAMTLRVNGGDKLFIDSSGYVGIGATPLTLFHVYGSLAGAYITRIFNNSSTGSGLWIRAGSTSAHFPFIVESYNGGTEFFKILGDGNVGISESTPERLLHVTGADMGASQSFSSTMAIFENSGSCDIIVRGTTGSAVYFGDAADGDIGGVLYNHSTNLLSLRANNTNILTCTNTTVNIASASGVLQHNGTTVLDASRNLTNINNINGSGLFTIAGDVGGEIGIFRHTSSTFPYGVLIDFSAASPDNNSQYFLKCEDSTAVRTYIYSDGDVWTSDAGTLTSDKKLKTNIKDVSSKLEDLLKLQVRNFNWKEDFHPEKKDKKMIGFIAQEFEKIFPGLVSEHNISIDDEKPIMRKAIKENKLIPIIIKAFQEMYSIFDNRLKLLENK